MPTFEQSERLAIVLNISYSSEEILLSAKPEQSQNEFEVLVGLLNGSEEHGHLIRFSPMMRRLALEQKFGRMVYFDVPEIAYIAFHRSKGEPPSLPATEKMKENIIHTVTGNHFHVQTTKSMANSEGFFAFSDNKDLPFERFFFYNHGVRSQERPEPFGQILIAEKGASETEVNAALERQKILQQQHVGEILVDQKKVKPADVEKALAKQGKKPKRIGEILIEAGLIQEDDLQHALVEQSKNRSLKIGQVMIKMGLVTEDELLSALAKKFNLPFVDLDDYVVNPETIEEIEIDLLLRYQVVPIASDEQTLTLASSDPIDFEAFDAIRFQTTKHLEEVLATPSQILKIIDHTASAQSGENDNLWIERIAGEKVDDITNEAVEVKAAEAAPIVRLVNKVLVKAMQKGASDIHILPQAKTLLLLFRINGDLQLEMELEKWVQRRMISRIKLLSGMNIADHRVTQDGRMMIRYEDSVVEFRVSCIPNAYGESIVMRILGKEMAANLQSLGVSDKDRRSLASMVRKPFGLILATGPTGSGKSTTLFALMQSIIDLPLHIITIEDPVESEIRGANQIQVNAKVGLTFASILRNVLRHDPDVIMVGEMRDKETASIGIEAALTGHLMLSTLHTNSAVDTIIRLQDLGIPDYLLAPALRGIISQSLLKHLCEQCRQPLKDEQDEVYTLLQEMGLERPKALYQAGQCESCHQTGFSGRVMAYEFLEITENVRQAIHDGKIGGELQNIAESEGMVPKAKHALGLAESGIISRDDLMRMLI